MNQGGSRGLKGIEPRLQPDLAWMDYLSVGVIIISSSADLLYSNQFFNDWLGYSSDDMTSLNLKDLFYESNQLATNQIKQFADQDAGVNAELLDHNQKTKKGYLKFSHLPQTQVGGFSTTDELFMVQIIDNETFLSLETELNDIKEFQSLITDTNQDLIFVKDEAFRIVFANQAFLNAYPEDKRDDIIGSTTFEDYLPDEMEEFLVQDKLAFKSGRSQVVETISMPDGQRRVFETTKIRFRNSSAQTFILGVARDVTKTHKLVNELERSNADLDQFAYVASHDLKSPAHAIKQLVGWLDEDCGNELNDQGKRHLDLLKNRADRMMTLLDDLLAYSRLSQADNRVKKFNLKQLVSGILELHNDEKQFNLTVDDVDITAPYVPTEIILRNLIFNAIQHHDKSQGTIQVFFDTHHSRLDYLKVIDDGPGIPDSFKSKATEMFQTLQSRDQKEGSGMGLAMVKKIVKSYHGQLNLESATTENGHRGLTVIISWPKKTFIDFQAEVQPSLGLN